MGILSKLTEGIQRRDVRKETHALTEKWRKTGLLEGLDEINARNMTIILENEAAHLSNEASSMAGGDVEGFAAVASLNDIKENGYNLNIPLYVAPPADANALTLEQALENLRKAHEAARDTRAALDRQLAEWGLT